MRKIELEIVAISHSISQTQQYAVVLGESSGLRRLPIVIGPFEAQAIAVAMEKMSPARPLTHDLIKNLCQEFKVELKEIIINNLMGGIFYSRLVCVRDGEVMEIDSRTSDALALAVRFDCPIYTYEFILDQAGIIFEDGAKKGKGKEGGSSKSLDVESSVKVGSIKSDYDKHTITDLNSMLEEAIGSEDYEKAARLRDEIAKRG